MRGNSFGKGEIPEIRINIQGISVKGMITVGYIVFLLQCQILKHLDITQQKVSLSMYLLV